MFLRIKFIITFLIITSIAFSQKGNNSTGNNKSSPNSTDGSKNINNYYKTGIVQKDYNKSASIKINNKDYAGARADYEKALTINPNDSKTHLNYALLLLNNFNDLQNAKKHFETSIACNPQDAQPHFVYSVFLRVFMNNKTAARSHYLIATKLKPSLINHDSDKFFGIKR